MLSDQASKTLEGIEALTAFTYMDGISKILNPNIEIPNKSKIPRSK